MTNPEFRMHDISKQTSLQAAMIIREVSKQDRHLELTVTRSGNVRIAHGLGKAFLRLIDFVDSDARAKRIEAAKTAVVNKLTVELDLLGVETSANKAPIIGKLADSLTCADGESYLPRGSSQSVIEGRLAQAIDDIRKVGDTAEEKSLKHFWHAIRHQHSAGRKADMNSALSIAQKTIEWSIALKVDEKAAFRLAVNAHQLKEKQGIPLNEGRDILQVSGRLISQHGFTHDAALQFAIDNQPVMQRLGIGMDSIERIMKALDGQIPALHTLPQITRVSAAIRYLQLQSDTLSGVMPIDEIRQSLADLSLLQQAMPRGCKIDQIHQGSHVRGRSALADRHFKELSDMAASLSNYPPFRGPIVHGVHLPENFRNFEKQHVEDLVRGSHFEICDDGKINKKFASPENERRKNPKRLAEDEYDQWAKARIEWAGSIATARTISHFESQRFFGDVETVTSNYLENSEGHTVRAFGDGLLSKLAFRADRKREPLPESFELRSTRYINASLLNATPGDETSDALLPMAVRRLPLLPNPDAHSVANPEAFSVKRECVIEANTDDLAKGLTRCRIIEVTEEWDIKLDWDSWRSQRNQTDVS